ncbi:MAG: 50S ribosomal protein L19 [Dehalococcoidia bacterium]|nr:50S ribosomal protein L19 [Dehalococcoidia bacterium]
MVNLRDLIPARKSVQLPSFRSGDTIKVNVLVKEGDRERTQAFQGVVIKVVGGTTPGAMFTVRRISHGVGVERTFFVRSPLIESVELVRNGNVRRARLFYLRSLSGKAARIKEKARKMGALAEAIVVEPEPPIEPAPAPAAEAPATPAPAPTDAGEKK